LRYSFLKTFKAVLRLRSFKIGRPICFRYAQHYHRSFLAVRRNPLPGIGFDVSAHLQSLELWRHALVASVRNDAPDLSARQMALMLCVYLGDGPHTVRGLATELRVSKPAISRALDRLGELGYLRRQRDDLDRRNVLVQKTQAGAQFLDEFSRLIDAARTYATGLPARLVEFSPEAVQQHPQAPQRQGWAAEAVK
jgi:DNA-binding MarR family transcriptional regulator